MTLTTSDPALARLTEQLRSAIERRAALNICGAGTKAFYGQTAQGETLDVRPLRGISQYEPSELVVTARAGTPLAELEAALAERGQCLPFEPPRFGGPGSAGGTVGGMVAAGMAGPARISAGGVRDYVLGATVLNGRAELLSFGGQVMKNVAGYDVARSFAGSLGVLGVLCEVSLKVLPLPAARRTLVLMRSEAEALALLARSASQPLPLQASAWHEGRLWLRLAGAHAAVQSAAATFINQGAQAVDTDEAEAWWCSLRDQTHRFFQLSVFERAEGERLWRLALPAATPALELPGSTLHEWHGSQRWLRCKLSAERVREAAQRLGGHATLMRGGDGQEPVFTPPEPALWRIHQALKTAFDPLRLFNPARLYPQL